MPDLGPEPVLATSLENAALVRPRSSREFSSGRFFFQCASSTSWWCRRDVSCQPPCLRRPDNACRPRQMRGATSTAVAASTVMELARVCAPRIAAPPPNKPAKRASRRSGLILPDSSGSFPAQLGAIGCPGNSQSRSSVPDQRAVEWRFSGISPGVPRPTFRIIGSARSSIGV